MLEIALRLNITILSGIKSECGVKAKTILHHKSWTRVILGLPAEVIALLLVVSYGISGFI